MQQSDSGDNQAGKVSEIEKAWLAGIIDGEGSIRLDYPRDRGSCQARITVTNTDWAIIEKTVDICRRLDANPHVQERKGANVRVKDVLILGMQKLLTLLPAIMPYLTGQKSEQALLLYRFCEARKQVDVNSLPNRARGYSQEEIILIHQIKAAKHVDTRPQRLNARPSMREDIVRPARRLAEVSRND